MVRKGCQTEKEREVIDELLKLNVIYHRITKQILKNIFK